MRISVIIPTLNEEKYIEATLFHIKNQKPLEMIVADSYSKDRTTKIAKRYGAKVVFEKRKNIAAARNAGARVAKGDILLFMDADSIAYPNLLETIKKDFSRDKKLVCWTCKIYAFSPLWKEHLLYDAFNRASQASVKIKKPRTAGVVMAVRKSAFDKINGFDERVMVFEDFDLSSRIKKVGNFKYSAKTCVYTSARRINQWGFWGSLKKYLKMYFKKAVNDKYIPNEYYTNPIR